MVVHVLIDAYKCDSPLLSDLDGLEQMLNEAADAARCPVLEVNKKQAKPRRKGSGVTLAVLLGLGDSHMTIHTYPDEGKWAADIYTYGSRPKPDEAIALIRQRLGGWVEVTKIERGR